MRLQIPYHKVLIQPRDFEPADFETLLNRYIETSRKHPVILEVFNDYIQYLAFMRERALYWAGQNDGGGYRGITIREFFSGLRHTQFPKIVAYYVDPMLCHSILAYLQKKPDLKASSALLDLDDLLDETERNNESAIVTAYQPGNFIMIRYQQGKAVACYHGDMERNRPGTDTREEFLVKVYTLSAHHPLEINLFTDLTVTHSEDSRPVPPNYRGGVSSFYMSQPPRLIVKLKNRPLRTYTFKGNKLTIGRQPQNDIVIDNLSVSRRHAAITSSDGGFVLKDLESKNGTYLNGKSVDQAQLKEGDTITIGKYNILFRLPGRETGDTLDLDQTVIIPNFRKAKTAAKPGKPSQNIQPCPRLFRRTNHEEYPIEGRRIVIGRGKDSDIRLKGLFASSLTVEIQREGDNCVLRKIKGRKAVSINGEEMHEKILEEEDFITVGSEEFVFKN